MAGSEEELLRMQQQALAHQQREEEELLRLQQQALQERQQEQMHPHPHHPHFPPPPRLLFPPPPPPPHLMVMDGPPGEDGGVPPPLMSLAVGNNGAMAPGEEGDEEVLGDVRLPQALEQALAFKSERAKQVGVRPEDVERVESEGLPRTDLVSESEHSTSVAREEDEPSIETSVGGSGGEREREKARAKRRQQKKRRRRKGRHQKDDLDKSETADQEDKEEQQVEIEYVADNVEDKEDPLYIQFAKILEAFRLSDTDLGGGAGGEGGRGGDGTAGGKDGAAKEPDLKKVPKLIEDEEELEEEEDAKKSDEEKPKLSKRKLKKLTRLSVAELKQLVSRPDVVEMHDVTARDPKLLVVLKAFRNTVPVPRHWCFKRKYLQGKRGIEKPPFQLPDFIKRTGIMEMRAALQEKEEQKTLKAKMRERVRPKLGKIDIDYQKLHDAFFKWQTKPRMTIHGDLYYEGKEFETRLKEKKPGELTDELRTALGMPVGPNAHKVPPPWLIAMQRYGPPPSYPNLKVPGLNAPIPEGCSFGYHAGGWGKPPVDEMGKPLYGDVFGMHGLDYQPPPAEEEVDRSLWGELESESEEEESSEEEEESEGEGGEGGEGGAGAGADEGGLVTPAEGLATPSGLASIPTGMETPEMIELRKRKMENELEGGETPALYTVLPERRVERVGGMMMGSTHVYDLSAAQPGVRRPLPSELGGGVEGGPGGVGAGAGGGAGGPGGGGGRERPGAVELALDPSELDLVDSELMHARYEQTIREQQNQLQKEDLSDMVAEHAAKQKNKRKRQAQQQENKQAKKYKEFKF